MTKKQGSFVAAGHESGTEHCVRILSEKHFGHSQQISRVIFQIGIVDHYEFSIHMQKPCSNSSALPAIFFVTQPHPR